MSSAWIAACFIRNQARHGQNISDMAPKRRRVEDDFLKKYSPKTPKDLVLQKPKLDQLNSWILEATQPLRQAQLLIMTGPSGCGKTTALRLLSKAQEVEVCEWSTPLDIENYQNGVPMLMQTQSTKFEEFLRATGRYISIFENVNHTKKLILVKDFPNIFLLQPTLLEDILRKYVKIGRIPIVFSLPEQMEGHGSLFSKQLIEELDMQQLSFNKVTNKSILKALKAISSTIEEAEAPPIDVIEKIVDNSHGDIRNAILQLSYEYSQYSSQCPNVDVEFSSGIKIKESKSKKRTGKKRKHNSEVKGSEAPKTGGRDAQLSIFHRVGRLLYPKKSSEESGKLKHNPEEIVEQTISNPRSFINMVHENYLKIFRDMNLTCHAISYASDADYMMSEFRERDLTLPMALSTFARGFMTCSTAADRKWTPLTSHENSSIRKKSQALREIMIGVNPRFSLIPRTASLDILPLICPAYALKTDGSFQMIEEATATACENIQGDSSRVADIEVSDESRLKGGCTTEGVESGQDDVPYEIEEIESDVENEVGNDDSWAEEDAEFMEKLHHL